MDKTVPELAEELDINKLRIYRYIKKQNIKPVRTDKNVQYFDEKASDTILNHFKGISGSHGSNTESDTTSDTAENALIELKDSIISRQDKEIKQLYRQVENLQRTIDQQNKQFDQQQQLELESIRTFKKNMMIDTEYHPDTESDIHDTSNDTKSDTNDTRGDNKKSGLFSWLRH
ncbi:hypothetical protein [Apilactobacillus kunkeei]|uniref:hypothetical protein n=1 Tax=Apilactobacillus kunkeei TaxID=148814 RepID=UPI0006C8396A|nr:hypothetical protein [Apilactobacillus kunkeei]